jgi:histidine phosphotransferase ChpT
MTQHDLTALVGARICHDLISPLGAIGNGVELLELTGMSATPEMTLISESVIAAQARLRFFGIAFGRPGNGLPLAASEVAGILQPISRGARLRYSWLATGDIPRPIAKVIFLLLQCMETAMPLGGDVRIDRNGTDWEIEARGNRMSIDDGLWNSLRTRVPAAVTPAQVQFALLPAALLAAGRTLSLDIEPGSIRARL